MSKLKLFSSLFVISLLQIGYIQTRTNFTLEQYAIDELTTKQFPSVQIIVEEGLFTCMRTKGRKQLNRSKKETNMFLNIYDHD